jgi:predicted AlkP superfamily pyrophosphatase or phosphodiesterase
MTQHTLLFLVDGMRPDGIEKAHTPAIDALMARGAWSMTATTVMPSVTLPCIMSLFQGSPPTRHGVTTNLFTPGSVETGLFEALAGSGHRAASFYNWEQLRDLARPGTLRTAVFLKNDEAAGGAGDTAVTRLAIDLLQASRQADPAADAIQFAFVYLGHTDAAGHAHGWMSAPYLSAIENADRCIDRTVKAFPDWNVVVTADHGGHDTGHGLDNPDDVTIPLVMAGPAVTARGRLDGRVSILDIAPTIAAWMGVDAPANWVGRALG